MFGQWLRLDRPHRPAPYHACHVRVERLEERAVPAIIAPNPGSVDTFATAPLIPSFDAVSQLRVQAVFQHGQQLGNRADAFIKIGDSITANANFLAPFGSPAYGAAQLGPFAALTNTLNYFRPSGSFQRFSTAARSGSTVLTALATVQGEVNAVRPAFAIVMLGTNDIAFTSPEVFRGGLTMLVQQLQSRGVVPILSTIPDVTFGGPSLIQRTRVYNQIIADVAVIQAAPLANYWLLLQSLPNRGLTADGVHPTVSPRGGGDFSTIGLQYGMNLRNLLTLVTLETVRQAVLVGR